MRLLAHGSWRQQHPGLHDGVANDRQAHTVERAVPYAEPFTVERAGVRLSEYVAHEPAKIAVLPALCRRVIGTCSRPCEFQYFIRSNRINK